MMQAQYRGPLRADRRPEIEDRHVERAVAENRRRRLAGFWDWAGRRDRTYFISEAAFIEVATFSGSLVANAMCRIFAMCSSVLSPGVPGAAVAGAPD